MSTPAEVPSFQFDEYTVRPTGERDRGLLEQFIAADELHAGMVAPDFFLKAVPGEDALTLEDAQGKVVFYLKTQVACRVHIQFGSAVSNQERARNRDALVKGLGWLEDILRARDFREIIFDSASPPLIQTAKRRLGFVEAVGDLRRSIPIPESNGSPHGARSATPTASESEAD